MAEARRALLKERLKATGAEYPEKRNLGGRALRSKARWSATPSRQPGGADEAIAVFMWVLIVEMGMRSKQEIFRVE
jgi:hypothetical protein